MKEINLGGMTVNPERLVEELAVMGEIGVKRSKGIVYLVAAAELTPEQVAQARSIALAHNPALLTSAQQIEKQATTQKDAVRQIQAELDQIDTDLAALPAATTAELRAILGRGLQRQKKIIQALRWLV